jgi:hypothetical protein
MKRTLLILLFLLSGSNALALEVAGVKLEPNVTLSGELLQLNGHGIRTKFFFDIYLGSLYTAQQATGTEAVLAQAGSKLIRMDFLHSRVDKKKIIAAFAEGFARNSPQLINTPEAQQFLAWFTSDFRQGDRVDLELSGDGRVRARHNGTQLGSLESPELAKGVLLIYLGHEPADDDLKAGMLGRS